MKCRSFIRTTRHCLFLDSYFIFIFLFLKIVRVFALIGQNEITREPTILQHEFDGD